MKLDHDYPAIYWLRAYRKAYKKIAHLYAGGGLYGFDTRTIKNSWGNTITKLQILITHARAWERYKFEALEDELGKISDEITRIVDGHLSR